MPETTLYVAARRALLDAIEALDSHRDALVLVGAQAIYLRVGDADMAVAAYTTDGDLALNPHALGKIPPIEQALKDRSFVATSAVGTWTKSVRLPGSQAVNVTVDLLAPATLSLSKGRSANLDGHHARVARTARGLEAAIVDHEKFDVAALEETDSRKFSLAVAGGGALLISKVHKIAERDGTARLKDKDALDIYRLLRGTETDDLAERCARLLEDDRSREVALQGLELFRQRFERPTGTGIAMLARSVELVENVEEVSAACVALANDLLKAVKP